MLTKRQQEVFDFIKDYWSRNGISPIIDEFREHFRWGSRATVSQHLDALESKGYITRIRHKSRSISIRSDNELPKSFIPLIGSANAGQAKNFADANIESYHKISDSLARGRKNLFAIKVQGDSMDRANISGDTLDDGDLAVIDPECGTLQDGDYVLSAVDEVANLKKFRRDKKTGSVHLISESTNGIHKPIIITKNENFVVSGRIIGVLKAK